MVKIFLTAFAFCAVSLVGASGQQPSTPPVAPSAAPTATPEAPAPIEPPAQTAQPAQAPQISPVIPTAGAPGDASVSGSGAVPITSAITSAGAAGRAVNEFQGDDVAQVLRLLARQAKINIVVSDKIDAAQMKITMRLEDKTPIEAIKVIANAKGLTVDENEGVYYVKTKEEKEQEPTESAYYTLSYASADKVIPLLAGQLASHAAPQFDQRTNTIFYRETKSNLRAITAFLDTIDKPTQQVMIEARLVEVNASPTQSYGLNWGGVVGSAGSPKVFQYGGATVANQQSVITTNPVTGATTVNQLPAQNTVSLNNGSAALNNFLFAPSPGTVLQNLAPFAGQLAILSAPQMSVTLRLLNEDADAEFLANPRIVTANNMVANIKITRNQPVPMLDFNSQTATAVFSGFQDKTYGSTLQVTPIINKDSFITMNVKPEISNKVGDQTFNFQGANVSSPIIDTRTLESNVLIKSGDTLAIGGLLQDETGKQASKVPVLGDIPVLGYMFQEHINARTKRNLLVFVTPTIIRQGYGTGLEDQAMGLHEANGEEYANPNGWRNNAKGSIRLVPTAHSQTVSQYPPPSYPHPGTPVNNLYKGDAAGREQ
jgi:type IV pilus assembly protein PilQ